MRDNVYEVLMYIFDHYMEEVETDFDQSALVDELQEVGFRRNEVKKAFAWLESLTEENQLEPAIVNDKEEAIRVYSGHEAEKLPPESRGFLIYLEHVGVLDAVLREIVIDRALALETEKIDLDQLKWVALMVLFNRAEQGGDLDWIEDLVFNEAPESIH